MRVPDITTTFCPRLHLSPMTAPGITWQKCQTFVPFPIVAPSSTYADSCTKCSLIAPRSGGAPGERTALGKQCVPFLERLHRRLARPQREDGVARRARGRQRGRVGDAVADRGLPQGVVVVLGVLAERRVDE